MSSDESFDPRTWQGPAADPVPVAVAEPAAPPPAPGEPARATRRGFAISAAILLAGATAAWSMRGDEPPVSPAAARPPG